VLSAIVGTTWFHEDLKKCCSDPAPNDNFSLLHTFGIALSGSDIILHHTGIVLAKTVDAMSVLLTIQYW